MKKRMVALFMAVVTAFSFAGCGNSDTNSTAQNSENTSSEKGDLEGDLEEFSVVLDWYPNAVHGFIYNAIEKGYYAEEGLDVKVYFPSNVNDAISLSAAGKVDLGIYYPNDVIRAIVNEDIPVKAVGTIVQSPLNIVAALKSKNITTPKDLEGKTIGYSGTEFNEALIKTMLESVGGSMDNVTLIDVGFDLMTSMTTERVDATIGCLVNHEIPALEEEGFEMSYFFPTDYGVPDYGELVFVAGDKLINENPEKIEKFLRASKKGFEDMKNDPEGTLKTLLENQNEENFPLSEGVEKRSIDVLLPLMETETAPFLSQNKEVWQNDIDWLRAEGLINEDTTVEDCVVDILK